MRAIAEMVEYFADEGILRHEQVRELREQGFWNISDDDYYYNYECDDYYDHDRNRDDGDWIEEPDIYENVQASLERCRRPAAPTWVGKARKRWWKGYQVGKVARARREANRGSRG
jgi:hypothetical protein